VEEPEENPDEDSCLENEGDLEPLYVYYINEHKFQKCPHVELHIGNQQVIAVIGSGSEVCVVGGTFRRLNC
jgi:hypothetical protein